MKLTKKEEDIMGVDYQMHRASVNVAKEINHSSIPRSYRDYLDLMQREVEFLVIDDEIDWHLEVGAILRRAVETLSP